MKYLNRRFVAVVSVFLALQCDALSAADEEWLGKSVMVKETAVPQVGTRRFKYTDIDVPAVVERVNGDWLWVDIAWVKKNEVVRLEDAPDYFTKMIARGNITDGYVLRGIAWLSLKQYEKAVKDFSEAIRRDPTTGHLHRLRGEAQYASHANNAALADYNKALQINPNDLLAMNGRGIALDAIGEYGKSLKQFNRYRGISRR